METSNLSDAAGPSGGEPPSSARSARGRARPVTLRTVLAYQWSDQFSEWLIYFAVVFSPWAFGTPQFWSGFNTHQFWSTWVVNVTGYLLGLLLLFKLLVRWRRGHRPARWQMETDDRQPKAHSLAGGAACVLTVGLAVLTFAILAYCLISALNARAVYNPVSMEFVYQSHVVWLPHSYDCGRTLQGFANYLALACVFWATRDWLLGKTPEEARDGRAGSLVNGQGAPLPARLRRLLWVISINGALLAAEGICQRLSGSGKLLWLVEPRINRMAEAQFGPYAYRSNAAQFFNLVWPVTLGFWWTIRHRVRHRAHLLDPSLFRRAPVLLVCVLLMAVCPIISYSRGGALVAFGNLGIAAVLLLFGLRRRHPLVKFGMLLFLGTTLALGLSLSWDKLSERLGDIESGYLGRESINQTARKMAQDYPLFGTGPGTFEPVFQLYRESPIEYWPAQLHNDWLETLITFGWVGSALIALAFASALARWFFPGNPHGGWRLVSLVWVALAGCLLHARFDFPLQIYSILLLFLVLCAIVFSLSRHSD